MATADAATLDAAALHDWLKGRADQKSERFPGHSIHFEAFPPRTITVPPGFSSDYIGNCWPTRFGLADNQGTYETALPRINEEYFELLDVFEAVIDAGDSFTMHEWGAGFARWASVGVRAARERGIEDVRIAIVEAEPKHLAFSIETMWTLGIRGERLKLHPFALAGQAGTDLFVVGRATALEGSDPWYGQALNDMGEYAPNGRTYHGRPELENTKGFRAIAVSVQTAEPVLAPHDFIDLINIDLQGVEADVIEGCVGELNGKVRRLHIGTHGLDIEARLRTTLTENGWLCLRDLPSQTLNDTSFGPVETVDGVQSWFNPRFPPRGFDASPTPGEPTP